MHGMYYHTPYGNDAAVADDNSRATELSQSQTLIYFPYHYTGASSEQDAPDTFDPEGFSAWNDPTLLNHIAAPQVQSFSADEIDYSDILNHSRSANEDPWTSVGGQPSQIDIQALQSLIYAPRPHTIAGGIIGPDTQRLLFPPTPDPSIVPPDSGYESLFPSCHDSHTHAEQSVVQRKPPPLWDSAPQQPTSICSEPYNIGKRRRTKVSVPPCLVCKKEFKNQSDAKKHRLKHSKPWMCREDGCSRKEGFATKNDLERHRKGVHGKDPCVGRRTGYICQACIADNVASASKWWPRQDNFKAHIQRRHKNWNTNNLIKDSEAPKPPDAVSESGYTSQMPGDQSYQDELRQSTDCVASASGNSMETGRPCFDAGPSQIDHFAGIGAMVDSSLPSYQQQPPHYSHSYATNALSMLSDAPFRVGSPIAMTPSASLDHDAMDLYTPQQHQSENRHELHWSASVWDSKRRCSSGAQEDLSMCRMNDGKYRCPDPGCEKIKNRECDLRKHMKRHSRPYGCTFPNCYKNFGSRNDWKRHESTQHHLNDMWRCEVEVNGTKCGRLFNSESDFKNHLQRKHGIHNPTELAQRAKDMHLGREGWNHFWCGFCQALIKPADEEPQDGIQRSAWVIRFQHIGDHLDRHDDIGSWVCIEHNKPKSVLTKEKIAKRNRMKRERDADDSDLGDDGIYGDVSRGQYSLATGNGTHEDRFSKKRRVDSTDLELDADGVSDGEC